MPLFVKHNVAVLYIHVPKTGGSSIEHFFEQNGFHCEFRDAGPGFCFNEYRHCSPQHMHAEQLRTAIRLSRVTYIFMTVRHPMSRLLSEFKTRVRDDGKPYKLASWVDRIFRNYIEDPFTIDNHIRPQSEFWIPGCDVFRQERGFGPALLARLEERAGPIFPHRTIGHGNTGPDMGIAEAEIAQIRPAVRQFYRQDFLTFGYKPVPGGVDQG
jgi:hypothetical protein